MIVIEVEGEYKSVVVSLDELAREQRFGDVDLAFKVHKFRDHNPHSLEAWWWIQRTSNNKIPGSIRARALGDGSTRIELGLGVSKSSDPDLKGLAELADEIKGRLKRDRFHFPEEAMRSEQGEQERSPRDSSIPLVALVNLIIEKNRGAGKKAICRDVECSYSTYTAHTEHPDVKDYEVYLVEEAAQVLFAVEFLGEEVSTACKRYDIKPEEYQQIENHPRVVRQKELLAQKRGQR